MLYKNSKYTLCIHKSADYVNTSLSFCEFVNLFFNFSWTIVISIYIYIYILARASQNHISNPIDRFHQSAYGIFAFKRFCFPLPLSFPEQIHNNYNQSKYN